MKEKLEIFIASSSAYVIKKDDGNIDFEETKNGRLKPIIKGLEDAGFTPIPWWDSIKVFNSGETFLTNLIGASKKFDGGIFIFGEDVEISEENQIKATHVPNSNVLLEAGMFYASKGKKRTFIVIDEDHPNDFKIHIPSDIAGYFVDSLNSSELNDKIKQFFQSNNENDKYDKVTFYIGRELTKNIIERKFVDWKSKAQYIGTESARIWNEIEGDESYKINVDAIETLIAEIISKNLVDFKKLDNIVSFGVGNGNSDNKFLETIIEENNSLCYVPIDINPMLVFLASENIDKTVRMPFALIDDFEGNLDHIKNIINGKIHDIGENNFFMMLGVTFSNLEGTEKAFFNKLKKWMEPNDYFLIDVSINDDNDFESIKQELSNNSYRKFIENSIAKRKIPNDGTLIGDIVTELISDTQIINNYTNIPNTKVYCYKYNGQRLLIFKRYNFEDLKDRIEKSFDLILSKPVSSQSGRKKAFFLFKLKI